MNILIVKLSAIGDVIHTLPALNAIRRRYPHARITWLVEEDDGSKRMESFKFGEPTWAPAETHGGKTSNVIQQCSVIEVELLE